VSAGIYGWPADDAARIAVTTVHGTASQVTAASFVLFTPDVLGAFQQALDAVRGGAAP
jgi:O-acetyl-ADP-ribose deacetylase (regulator of RNase III)